MSATSATLVAPATGARGEALSVKRLGRWRLTQVAICVAVIALPLLRPSGPGNTGLVDLALVGAMMTSAVWASARSYRIGVPYAGPVGLIVLAGALALTVATVFGGKSTAILGPGLVAIAQDIFVLAWAAAITTLGRDHQLLDTLIRAWAYSAAGWAAVLIAGDILGIGFITGITARDGIRASFTLGDPNLAADYFLVALLVAREAQRPRHTVWRWITCTLIVIAIILTLSNGGILALLVATVLGGLFRLARRRGMVAAAMVGAILALAGGAATATINPHAYLLRLEEASPLVRDSIGRQAESGGSRATIAQESLNLWLHGDTLFGLGPGNTEATLRERQASYVKEAHDDYLAALLERGLLGAVALLLLIAAVTVRTYRISQRGALPAEYHAVVPRPELLAAAVIAVAISAMFYETLHFRHVWALLGVVAALDIAGRSQWGRAR